MNYFRMRKVGRTVAAALALAWCAIVGGVGVLAGEGSKPAAKPEEKAEKMTQKTGAANPVCCLPGAKANDAAVKSGVSALPLGTKSALACKLTDKELAARRAGALAELKRGRQETRELADGWAIRFPGDEAWTLRLAEFVNFERRCCPFMKFEIEFEPEEGPVWLKIRGPEGVKAMIAGEIGIETAKAEEKPGKTAE